MFKSKVKQRTANFIFNTLYDIKDQSLCCCANKDYLVHTDQRVMDLSTLAQSLHNACLIYTRDYDRIRNIASQIYTDIEKGLIIARNGE